MLAALILGTATVLSVGLVLAWLRERRALGALLRAIEAAAQAAPRRGATRANGTLPAPVARYLERALASQPRDLRLVRYRQIGALRADTRSDRWLPFTASQVTAPGRCAFVWDARVRNLPLLHVRVRDSLVDGRGAGQVALLSAIPVRAAGGNAEMNSGALHRFLAEALWYPSALRAGPLLRWEAIDDRRANATLTCHGLSVSLEFRFNERDEVAGIYTSARWGSFAGGYRQAPWEGRFGDYAVHEGLWIPTRGEVGWYVDGEWQCVWRAHFSIALLEFD